MMETGAKHIKKVIVVHKTHLDIGFTDSAQRVLDQYVNRFIPAAIETARACNRDGQKNFVWTVGSFLIEYFLENAKDPMPLVEAIEAGHITWHGLAFSTHTELMNGELVQYNLSIAKGLDKRFGKTTIAAKMSDVPGHTQGLIPHLAQNGIRYLHIGVNRSSRMPDVPPICRWRYGEDEVILHYAGAYGAEDAFGDCILEFAHTADNMGPPTPERVWAELERLKEKYPGAQIVSGTLDEFALEVLAKADQLPVITSEIGDTWIHGAATDPYKVAAYGELLGIAAEWKAAEKGAENTRAYRDMMRGLLLVCEHTWGMDSKRYFSDYKNWDKPAFAKARLRDYVEKEDIAPAGEAITAAALGQKHFSGTYSGVEASWGEQRDYLQQALNALPEAYRQAAFERLDGLRPKEVPQLSAVTEEREFEINGHRFRVLEDGSVQLFSAPGMTFENAYIGRLGYRVYSAKTMWHCYETYNRNRDETFTWSYPDFGKPGLDSIPPYEDGRYGYTVARAAKSGNTLEILLKADEKAATEYGAPRQALATYTFGKTVDITLQWFEKDACRIPEALFFGMQLGFEEKRKLFVKKLDRPVNPYDVVPGGNRKLHGVQEVCYEGVRIEAPHSPLVSIGGEHLYDTDDAYGDIKQGIAFVLFNNRWNTNFRLWYEENASFSYRIHLAEAGEGQ